MSHNSWTRILKTTLPSKQGAHLPVMEEVLSDLEKLGWDNRDRFAVHMALEESLTNAIRHGNKFDESKVVHVEIRLSPERFWLEVEDQGDGFQQEQVPDCTCNENLGHTGGRGLMLIRSFMTSVDYNDKGNCCRMEKIREPETAQN